MLNNTELLKTAGYINGQWMGFDSDNRFEVKNAYTKEVICTLPEMGAKETNMAIDAANQAWPSWRSMTAKERAGVLKNWFDLDCDSQYMLLVSDVKKNIQIPMKDKDKNLFGIDKLNIKRSSIPAVTHVDYSARVQTVHKDTNLRYYKLIKKFKDITGCPLLVNTSFNVRGEPIVCSIEDSFRCFMGTNLDILVCENFILLKEKKNQKLLQDYKNKFEKD